MNLLEYQDPDTLRRAKFLNLGPPSTLEIINNAVIVTRSQHQLLALGNTPQRRLNTINGGAAWDLVLFRLAPGSGTATLRDGVDNLHLTGDCTLGTERDLIILFCLGAEWIEVCRAINS